MGEKAPLDVPGVTGGLCDPCMEDLLAESRPQAAPAYHLILNRHCAHLLDEVTRLLRGAPHVRVLVDRRRSLSVQAVPPPLPPAAREAFAVPPRPYHLVIRRDCAHLYDDLAQLFAERPDIRVLVDRRNRSRTPPRETFQIYPMPRLADPPAWLV